MAPKKSIPKACAVGKNICILRRQCTKFSQKEIADMIGVDRNTYASWEKESTPVKAEFIPKLAEIFKVEIKDLFENNIRLPTDNRNTYEDLGAIILLSDKEAINQLLNSIKGKIVIGDVKKTQ